MTNQLQKKALSYDLAPTPQDPAHIRALTDEKVDLHTNTHWGRDAITNRTSRGWRVILNTNDYLGLARHPRVAIAKAAALLETGHGEAVSRVFIQDRDDAHRTFERRFAALIGAQDAVLVMSGYNANTSIVQVFARPGSPVYLDMRAHASLWEGVLCARARAIPFRHNDPADLRRKIALGGPGLVIVDSLYSTDGSVCPLIEIVEQCERGGCAIVVDETHAFGCHGHEGGGMVSALGLTARVHFRTIGLSKAVAARGGIVAGSARNMELFRYEARPLIFSTTVLGYEIAGFNAVLDLVRDEPWRAARLHRNHARMKEDLQACGFDVAASESQILAIVTGAPDNTIAFRRHLDARGIRAAVFGPPATPPQGCLLRMSLSAMLTDDDIAATVEACRDALSALDMRGWPCVRQQDGAASGRRLRGAAS